MTLKFISTLCTHIPYIYIHVCTFDNQSLSELPLEFLSSRKQTKQAKQKQRAVTNPSIMIQNEI